MSYPPQQPGGWPDQSWPAPAQYGESPAQYGDPSTYPASGGPAQPGSPASGYPPAYGYGGYAPPVVPAGPGTNGMAIASMVVSLVGAVGLICYGIGGVLGLVGAILGHLARKQIREQSQGGDGMALAGIIVGWASVVLALIIVALIAIFVWWAVKNTPAPYPS
jgi:Domain of unknown function (DUF4190)